MDIKDIILEYRKKNDMSQREFARRCSLSNSLISILEMGVNPQTGKKMSPDLDTYKKLASGMGMSMQSLFEMLDASESISLSFNQAQDLVNAGNAPVTQEARIISGGIDKMPPERREQALKVLQTIFADYFDGGDDYET